MSGSPFEMVFQETAAYVFGQAEHCPDCTGVVDGARAAATADAPVPAFDLSVTLDGALVASAAFAAAAEVLAGAVFSPIEGWPGYSVVDIEPVVRIDPFDSRVRFGAPCATCGAPRWVVRHGPIRLAAAEMVRPGFNRTDIVFGDTADFGPTQPVRMRPNIVIDRGTARLLKDIGLLGIHVITQP